MLGATAVTCALGPAAPAVVPFTVGLLAASVAWGRRHASGVNSRASELWTVRTRQRTFDWILYNRVEQLFDYEMRI